MSSVVNNLNEIYINSDHSHPEQKQKDNTVIGKIISVYFKNQIEYLIEHIKKADIVIGCVAWLTNYEVLNALKHVPKGCKIIVQKEDFLRPDDNKNNKNQLYNIYNSIKPLKYHFSDKLSILTNTVLDEISIMGHPQGYDEAIRCCGNYNKDKNPAFPRMHNKFLVFCMLEEKYDDRFKGLMNMLTPYGVWTGSLNLTHNSMNSLENGLYITENEIVKAYVQEWANIMAISEELNWDSVWSTSDQRIGS